MIVLPARNNKKNELRHILNYQKDKTGISGVFSRLLQLKIVLPFVMMAGVGLVGVIVWYIGNNFMNQYNNNIMQNYQTTKASEIASKVKPYFSGILPILPQMVAMTKAGASVEFLDTLMFSAMQNYEIRFIDITMTDGSYHGGYTRNDDIYKIEMNTTDNGNARYYVLDQQTGMMCVRVVFVWWCSDVCL